MVLLIYLLPEIFFDSSVTSVIIGLSYAFVKLFNFSANVSFCSPLIVIFVIMYFGGTVIASAWGIVALTSVWNKKMSESGAFYGMLFGFLGCAVTKSWSALTHTTLPIYLDPFFVGLVLSIIGMVIGNRAKKATKEEIQEYEELHVRPESEKNAVEEKKTFNLTYLYLAFGVVLGLVFVFAYAIPYMNAVR